MGEGKMKHYQSGKYNRLRRMKGTPDRTYAPGGYTPPSNNRWLLHETGVKKVITKKAPAKQASAKKAPGSRKQMLQKIIQTIAGASWQKALDSVKEQGGDSNSLDEILGELRPNLQPHVWEQMERAIVNFNEAQQALPTTVATAAQEQCRDPTATSPTQTRSEPASHINEKRQKHEEPSKKPRTRRKFDLNTDFRKHPLVQELRHVTGNVQWYQIMDELSDKEKTDWNKIFIKLHSHFQVEHPEKWEMIKDIITKYANTIRSE